MRRVLLFGVVAAVLLAVVTGVGQMLGILYPNVLVGIAAGAGLGLVRVGSPGARAGAFLVGFVICIVGYLIRVTLLPTYWLGMIVFGALVILLVTVISALTRGRLPLFAMFLGVVVFSGTMESPFILTPWFLLSLLPQLASGLLMTVAAGFLVTLLVELMEDGPIEAPMADPMLPAPASADQPVTAVAVAAAEVPSQANPGLQVLDGSNGGNK